jgi:hypothetical protein
MTDVVGRFFIFRTRRWRLQRIMRDQVRWDRAHHSPVYKWCVTFSNGSDVRHGMSKWLWLAVWRARWGLTK